MGITVIQLNLAFYEILRSIVSSAYPLILRWIIGRNKILINPHNLTCPLMEPTSANAWWVHVYHCVWKNCSYTGCPRRPINPII